MKKTDSTKYGLSKRTTLFKDKNGNIIILINRKSRIIMKDGKKIVEMAHQINKIEPTTNILFETNAPMCSKTKVFLINHGITTKETK